MSKYLYIIVMFLSSDAIAMPVRISGDDFTLERISGTFIISCFVVIFVAIIIFAFLDYCISDGSSKYQTGDKPYIYFEKIYNPNMLKASKTEFDTSGSRMILSNCVCEGWKSKDILVVSHEGLELYLRDIKDDFVKGDILEISGVFMHAYLMIPPSINTGKNAREDKRILAVDYDYIKRV